MKYLYATRERHSDLFSLLKRIKGIIYDSPNLKHTISRNSSPTKKIRNSVLNASAKQPNDIFLEESSHNIPKLKNCKNFNTKKTRRSFRNSKNDKLSYQDYSIGFRTKIDNENISFINGKELFQTILVIFY